MSLWPTFKKNYILFNLTVSTQTHEELGSLICLNFFWPLYAYVLVMITFELVFWLVCWILSMPPPHGFSTSVSMKVNMLL